ncbi:hypothetical protein HYC85_031971 [Camellia sinensis]|uniref:Uncharacterized protein n=1 Tax=Camellia sinensis TaxID=4442 RepID=A0A7J7FTV7_CAMSI|nr:hypothetical protein HYC85_031971 [Camellia sinensis]
MSGRNRGRGSGVGGGDGGGRGRAQPRTGLPSPAVQGRGRGRGGAGPAPTQAPPPTVSQPPVVSHSPPPSQAPSSSTTRTEVSSLSQDVESKLSLQTSPSPVQPITVLPSSSKSLRPPARPGYGTIGRKCIVRANHFLVDVANKDLHHYDVTITPEVASKKVCRDIISELIASYRESHLGKLWPAYDGRKSLFTAGKLPFISKDFVVKLVDKYDQTRREREFKVAIKFAAKADIHHLQEFLRGRQFDAPQETVQVLDVVFRSTPSTIYTVVGRSFFSPILGEVGDLGDGLQYWKGFYQSLRPTQMGLSLNIDMSARAFYEPILVSDFVAKYFNVRDLTRPLSDQDRIKVKRALKGIRVELTHREDGKRYKISGVSAQPTSQLTFARDDTDAKISVIQYFRERYHINLKFAFLPALQAGSDLKPVYLPMELCKIVEGQRYSKKLNEKQVTALLRATCQRPFERVQSISRMVERNNYNNDKFVNEFGLRVKTELTSIDARVLPAPMKMVNGGKVEFWTCVSFSRLRQNEVFKFCENLVDMCRNKGMDFNLMPLIPIRLAHPAQIERTLVEIHTQSNVQLTSIGKADEQLQMLIIILPEVTGSYGRIKRVCETELGIISQCCQPKQAMKCNKQYLENVSLKINVKVVASMDWPEATKYRGLVSAQPHREEIIQDLYKTSLNAKNEIVHGGMIRDMLISFRRSTGQKPCRIIFYRDGVSEGQFNQVLLYEMDAIRKACVSLEADYLPRVTFVVVQKRHHTRLFPAEHGDRNSTDRSGNILPGTVVETKICHPTQFDFYLCSHAGIQVNSVILCLVDPNLPHQFDLMRARASISLYARCTRSVSVVPPAYYAHLAAFRARYYIEGETLETGSSSGGGRGAGQATRERSLEVQPLPQIKDNVKAVMFYC